MRKAWPVVAWMLTWLTAGCSSQSTQGVSAACPGPSGVADIAFSGGANWQGPVALAVDSTNVYWTNTFSGVGSGQPASYFVASAPRCAGGEPVGMPTTLASGSGYTAGLAENGGRLYWGVTELDGPGSVLSVRVGGGAVTTVASTTRHIAGFTMDETNVYWTEGSVAQPDGAVVRAPIAGGAATTLAPAQLPGSIAVARGDVFWINQNASFPDFLGEIRVLRAGAQASTRFAGPASDSLVATSTALLWISNDVSCMNACTAQSDAIWTAPLEGGSATILTAANPTKTRLGAMLSDDRAAYVDEASQTSYGSLVRVPVAGGAPATLATHVYVTAMVLDAANVYWADLSGFVERVAR